MPHTATRARLAIALVAGLALTSASARSALALPPDGSETDTWLCGQVTEVTPGLATRLDIDVGSPVEAVARLVQRFPDYGDLYGFLIEWECGFAPCGTFEISILPFHDAASLPARSLRGDVREISHTVTRYFLSADLQGAEGTFMAPPLAGGVLVQNLCVACPDRATRGSIAPDWMYGPDGSGVVIVGLSFPWQEEVRFDGPSMTAPERIRVDFRSLGEPCRLVAGELPSGVVEGEAFAQACAGEVSSWEVPGTDLPDNMTAFDPAASQCERIALPQSASAAAAWQLEPERSVSATASVDLSLGTLRFETHSETKAVEQRPPAEAHEARIDAGWLDRVVVSSPGLAGTPVTIHGALSVNGRLFEDDTHLGFIALDMASSFHSPSARRLSTGGDNDGFAPSDELRTWVFPVELSAVVGEETDWLVRATASIWGHFGDEANSSGASFYRGVTWAGIEQVTHRGEPLVDYHIASAAGFDWRTDYTAVPEPAEVPALAAGAAALAAFARRRARSASASRWHSRFASRCPSGRSRDRPK